MICCFLIFCQRSVERQQRGCKWGDAANDVSSAKAAKEMPLIKPLAALGKDQHHKEQTRVIMQDTKATSNMVADASPMQPKTLTDASVDTEWSKQFGHGAADAPVPVLRLYQCCAGSFFFFKFGLKLRQFNRCCNAPQSTLRKVGKSNGSDASYVSGISLNRAC